MQSPTPLPRLTATAGTEFVIRYGDAGEIIAAL
jgi:hypothetical protein